MRERGEMDRRQFVMAAAAAALSSRVLGARSAEGASMTMDLVCGAIGVEADQMRAIDLAAKNGFESVGVNSGELARMTEGQIEQVRRELDDRGLVWGAAGLPVQFRESDSRFRSDLEVLKKAAFALQRAGVTRMSTWIMPNHDLLTYRDNFRLHQLRLREIADILVQHQIRFGLEYVGPRTSWTAKRHPFIHTLEETQELIAEIARDNVGLVLDSWHWYTAGETREDLLSLSADEVVAVDLNDAPEGIPVEEQMDLTRRLPTATGVIDLKTFLNALAAIGYDGPARAEPFDQSLNQMEDEAAVARTAQAMKAAFALIDA